MKKLLAALVALGLFLLMGCGKAEVPADGHETTVTSAHTSIAATETETQPQIEEDEKWVELNPPADCEIIMGGFAKTPTHYYAEYDGGIIRAPIDNITRQTKISLPDMYEGMKLSVTRIIGITEEWLFVSRWEAREKKRDEHGNEWEDYENRTAVTFRVALDDWKAEALIAEKCDYVLPWYNPIGDALLIPRLSEDTVTSESGNTYYPTIVDVMPLGSRKRSTVMFDGKPLITLDSSGRNTLDGRAAFPIPAFPAPFGGMSEDGMARSYYVFDENNQVSEISRKDINLAIRSSSKEAPQNEMEASLRASAGWTGQWSGKEATVGDYVYSIRETTTWQIHDFHRVKLDGTDQKLLRKDSNIFGLRSVGGKLFCQAYNPSVTKQYDENGPIEEEIGIHLLDYEGKPVKTLFRYWSDHTTGNSGHGLTTYNDKLMVTYGVIYGPPSFTFLYDPLADAFFPPQE